MEKEYWGALVNALALIVTQLAAFYLDEPTATLIARIIAIAQPVIIPLLVKIYADRKAAEAKAQIDGLRAEIAAVREASQG